MDLVKFAFKIAATTKELFNFLCIQRFSAANAIEYAQTKNADTVNQFKQLLLHTTAPKGDLPRFYNRVFNCFTNDQECKEILQFCIEQCKFPYKYCNTFMHGLMPMAVSNCRPKCVAYLMDLDIALFTLGRKNGRSKFENEESYNALLHALLRTKNVEVVNALLDYDLLSDENLSTRAWNRIFKRQNALAMMSKCNTVGNSTFRIFTILQP